MNLTMKYALKQAEKEIDRTLLRMAREQGCEIEELDEGLVEATRQEIIDSWEAALESKCEQIIEDRRIEKINRTRK